MKWLEISVYTTDEGLDYVCAALDPDPAAGFDEIGDPAPLHALFLGWLLHTFSVEAVRVGYK